MSEKPDVKVALATFNERFMAGLIDYLIVYGIYIVATIFLLIFIWIVPWLGYVFLWMPYKNDGQTFGKKKQNIKIMFIEDEAKWTLRPVQEGDLVQLLIRAIVGGFEVSFIPVVIAWYFITNDKNRQRLADQVAKTVIVQCDSETGQVLKKPRVVAEKKKE